MVQTKQCFVFPHQYNLLTLPKTEFDITNTEKIRTIIKEHNPEIIINETLPEKNSEEKSIQKYNN